MNDCSTFDLIVVGGGAAGFFTAAHLKTLQPDAGILILEKQAQILQKVKISGGGRCNVTHACFDPKELTTYYPRGQKELLGPFHRFGPAETVRWFAERGVTLHTEADGRMFPSSNQSQTIIDCLCSHTLNKGVCLKTRCEVTALFCEGDSWVVVSSTGVYRSKFVLWATGSSPKSWKVLSRLGHTVIPPKPSLFTFDTQDALIKDLAGVSTSAQITLVGSRFTSEGAMLFTHRGISGPAVLKLSAFAAIFLAELNYRFTLHINWVNMSNEEEVLQVLHQLKMERAKQLIAPSKSFDLPKRLWTRLVVLSGISEQMIWVEIDKKMMRQLAQNLNSYPLEIKGKSTFKEEFVTAGGIDRKEINFKNFESKLFPQLYFAGEDIDIDAVTGGFNFQNAWTGGYLVAEDMALRW